MTTDDEEIWPRRSDSWSRRVLVSGELFNESGPYPLTTHNLTISPRYSSSRQLRESGADRYMPIGQRDDNDIY